MSRWSIPFYSQEPVSSDDLLGLEETLRVLFPLDYFEAVTSHGVGNVSTRLKDDIAAWNANLFPIEELLAPVDIADLYFHYRTNADADNFLPIASGSRGDFFGFHRFELAQPRRPDFACIYRFNYDTNESEFRAGSFESWIDFYVYCLTAHS